MSPAVRGSRIMASPLRLKTAAANSAMGGETTQAVSVLERAVQAVFLWIVLRSCGHPQLMLQALDATFWSVIKFAC